MSKTKSTATVAGAGCIAACVAFLPNWEGMDKVAKADRIGTGHPITYCYGQTDEFGKVKAGTRFTKQECDEKLAESLPKYLAQIDKCIKVDLPDKTKAALLDAAYNAGSGAVCKSPMVRLMNAGDFRGGCNAFTGWYVRSDGQVRKGLVARRQGIGDGRKSEKDLCLEGLKDGVRTVVAALPSEGCTYTDQAAHRCAIPAPKHVTTDCGTPGAVACTSAPVNSCPWWRKCR